MELFLKNIRQFIFYIIIKDGHLPNFSEKKYDICLIFQYIVRYLSVIQKMVVT